MVGRKINAKKSLGQNFLIDNNIIEKIINSFFCDKNDLIIEIGPGRGALTEKLKTKGAKLICFELDTDLKEVLNSLEDENTKVIYDDFLKVDLNKVLNDYKYKHLFIVGNLPYYITTPILEHIINQNIKLDGLTIMVQKEVAERFMAKPKSKEYGYFTLFLQHYFNITKVVNVGNECFYPSPKVDSMVIKLVPRNVNMDKFKEYNNFIKKAFIHKRKTLRNNLGNELFNKILNKLNEMGYSESVRAEEISEKDYVELVNYLYQ